MHVRKKWEFQKIRKAGAKFYGKFVCFQYVIENKDFSKLGLTVSRKFGGAIKRNLFKRRMREFFRTLQKDFPLKISINILPLRAEKPATYLQLKADWDNFLLHLNKGNSDDTTP